MPFASACSTRPAALDAVAEVCGRVPAGPWGLAAAFFTPQPARHAAEILAEIRRLSPDAVLGCTAQGVLADGREIENGPALSLWLARWPRPVSLKPFHLTLERTADGPSLFGLPDELLAPSKPSAVLLVADPYSFPADFFLRRLAEDAPGVPVHGGMASGARVAGDARLLAGDAVHSDGAACVLLQGEFGLRSVVSQGCRPIGRPFIVTKADENHVLELGGRVPMEQLRGLYASLPEADRALFHSGLQIGRVLNEYQGEFRRGDFLIRDVIGIVRDTGALLIGDSVRVGQTVQFQVRDAASATEDLHALLQRDAATATAGGALVFTCNGRGTSMFAGPDHDACAVRQEAGPVPLAGFFAAGEIGPVGGQNFVHGYTASVALFGEG